MTALARIELARRILASGGCFVERYEFRRKNRVPNVEGPILRLLGANGGRVDGVGRVTFGALFDAGALAPAPTAGGMECRRWVAAESVIERPGR